MLLFDVFRFCPERASHFLPFISVNPGRMIQEQLAAIHELEQEFPIYGIKVIPVGCQTKVTKLLEEGEVFLELAHKHDWPILFHVTTDPQEGFSGAAKTFTVIEKHPELRYCLAHPSACIVTFLTGLMRCLMSGLTQPHSRFRSNSAMRTALSWLCRLTG